MNNFIFKWKNREIRVKILENLPEIQILTTKIGPYEKQEEIKIPFWIAKILFRENLAEYIEPVEYEIEQLLKIEFIEQEKSKITEIDKEFYLKTQETISNLLNKIKNNEDFSINAPMLQKKDKMSILFRDIFSRRLYKILRIASMSSGQSKFLNNFTEEELMLYTELRKIIKEWVDDFIDTNDKSS